MKNRIAFSGDWLILIRFAVLESESVIEAQALLEIFSLSDSAKNFQIWIASLLLLRASKASALS